MKLTKIAFFGMTITVITFCQQLALSQEKSNFEELEVNITRKTNSFFQVLADISSKNNLPIGVQVSMSEEPEGCRKPINLERRSFVLKDLLEILISECPLYNWSVDGNLVNVFPRKKEISLLDSKVHELEIENKTIDEIVDYLFKLPNIQKDMEVRGLLRDTTKAFPAPPAKSKTYNLNVKDKTLRQVFNYLITNTDSKFWVFYLVGQDRRHFSVNIF